MTEAFSLNPKTFSIFLSLSLSTHCLVEKLLPLNVGLGRGKNNSGIAKECNTVFKVFQEQLSEYKFKGALTLSKKCGL